MKRSIAGAPLRGQHIMLSGIRVLALTCERGFLAGKILGDMGADVVKIEAPTGDAIRQRGPFLAGKEGPERSLPWLALNTSKRGITLDLDQPDGQDVFRTLAKQADIVLESFQPGLMKDRGLGYAALVADNPKLIYCAISPFGQDGPYSHYNAHDLVIVAMSGNLQMTGDPDRPPIRCTMPTSYYHAAPEAVLGIIMALYSREDSQRGQFVDVSMQETHTSTLLCHTGNYSVDGVINHRAGYRVGPSREVWKVKDGYISYGLRGGPTRVPNLVATVEYMDETGCAPEWLKNYNWKNYDVFSMTSEEIAPLEEAFGSFFETKTRAELFEESVKRRIMLAPCNDSAEVLAHRQLRSRDLFVTLDYPELGASIDHPNFFAKTTGNDVRIRGKAPKLGEHTDAVLQEAGISTEKVSALRQQGVI